MSLVNWCPQCKLPLTADESADGRCALCGLALNTPAGSCPEPVEPVPAPRRSPPAPTRWLLWTTVGLQVLTLALVCVAITRRPHSVALPADRDARADDRAGQEAPPRTAEKPPAAGEFVGPPEELKVSGEKAPRQEVVGPPDSLKGAPAGPADKPALVGPPAELKAAPRPIRPPAFGNEVKLDDPDGDYAFESLQGGKTLKLIGKVRRLTIGQLNDRAVLDASQLEVKEVVVLRNILNEATLKLNAPDGSVEFRGQVASRVKVFINAPGGTVTFKEKGGIILNEARIELTARHVDFQDRIEGSNTLVTATLTAGATVKYRSISNSAKVYCKRADGKDPPVAVTGGDVFGQGEFRRLN
jgi:hypothetical protein